MGSFSFDDLLNVPTVGLYGAAKYAATGHVTGGGVPGLGSLPGTNDYSASPYQADPGATSYGGGAGGRWIETGEQEPMVDAWGHPMNGPDGRPIMVPKRRWLSTSDEAAAKYGSTERDFLNSAGGFYDEGRQDRANAGAARAQQMGMADLMAKRARGEVPSIAEMQAARDSARLAAEQSSIAAGARGPAALALAQQNAAFGSATGQSAISQQAQIAAAQERMQAEQNAFNAYGGVRGQDYQGQGLSYQAAGNQNQGALGFADLENRVRTTAGQLGVQREQINQQSYDNASNANAKVAQGNADTTKQYVMGAVNVGQGFIPKPGGAGSDINMKMGVEPLGGGGGPFGSGLGGMPMGGGGSAYDDGNSGAVLSGGGMDVMGTLRKYSDMTPAMSGGTSMGSAFAPVSMPGSAVGMYSDERAKEVLGLYEPPGQQLHMSPEGRAMLVSNAAQQPTGASLAGPVPRYGVGGGAPAVVIAAPASGGHRRERPMTHDEMMRAADELLAQTRAATARAAVEPPSARGADGMTAALAEGAAPYRYEYKPGMGPPGPNVGPMAQNLASNPVTGVAVEREPQTGLLMLDPMKTTKLALGGVGHLARKQQDTDARLSQLEGLAGVGRRF